MKKQAGPWSRHCNATVPQGASFNSLRRLLTTLVAAISAFLLCAGCTTQKGSPLETWRSSRNEFTDSAAKAWEEFLAKNCKPGMAEADIEKLMAGKFRDRGMWRGMGSGRFIVFYLVDDFHEIGFCFEYTRKLRSTSVYERSAWVRFPDGDISVEP